MRRINNLARRIINFRNRKRLKNRDFSLISSNCNGGFILHDLGMRFNSPFVNLWMKPCDYIKFLNRMEYYSGCKLGFVKDDGISYPIGILDDIKIYFQHYLSEEEARNKWMERMKRIRKDNLFILFTDRDGCTYQDLCEFDALPYKNKVVFTHVPYPKLKSTYCIKGWEKEECIGFCYEYKGKISGKRYYDDFDYVSWFNSERGDSEAILKRIELK